jgi:hypothetical protein
VIVVPVETGVGWNPRTKLYHRIKHNRYINIALCDPGTLIDHAGTPEQSERQPCKKCFPSAKG